MLQFQTNMPAIMNNPELWNAVLSRDATRDGSFVFAVRSTGTAFGHTIEAQFPLGLALAALSISRGALFPPNDPTGFEVEKPDAPTQIVVVGAGHWQGEGMALVEAVKQ